MCPGESSDISGDWKVVWQGRLGSENCDLNFQTEAGKVTGNWKDSRGLSKVSGTYKEGRLVFDVHFEGARPYTIEFAGHVEGGKLQGTSQAVGMPGSGAYLGHGGEVVQPEHPWSGTRVGNDTAKN